MTTSFVDQKPRVATEKDVQAKWGPRESGDGFRCYMCGHRFEVGDVWRWVYAVSRSCINFLVCEKCDGENVLDRWVMQNEEAGQRFWWLRH